MEFPADAPHRQDLMAVLQEEEAALARHRFFRGAVIISGHLFREVETARIQMNFEFLKWRAHNKVGQLEEVAA